MIRIFALVVGFVHGVSPMLAIEFDAKLIHHLPPSVAEWHSREGIEFCATAEAKGMSWAEAHLAFTGEELTAEVESPNCLLFYSGRSRAGRIYLIEQNEASMLLRIITDPEGGTFLSSRLFRLFRDEIGSQTKRGPTGQ